VRMIIVRPRSVIDGPFCFGATRVCSVCLRGRPYQMVPQHLGVPVCNAVLRHSDPK
jgi:hypothetical protein